MGSPSATFTGIMVPVVMLTLSLRSIASITTGYSDGRPSGVFTPHSSLLTEKNAAGAIEASADVIFRWSGGLLLVAVPPYGDGPSIILSVPNHFVALAVSHAGAGNLFANGLQVHTVVLVLM